MSQSGPKSASGSGAPPIETITGNSGGPVPPDATFNLDLLGNTTTGIETVGNAGLNTITILALQSSTTQFGTIQLATNAEAIAGIDTNKAITSDDLKAKLGTQTAHGLAIFEGSSSALSVVTPGTSGTILQSQGAGSDPTYTTATYPSTTTVNQILYSSITNNITGLATANQAVLTTGLTGIPVLTPLALDGQLIIGSTAGVPTAATLSAGTGISIINASNSITINSTGSGFSWSDNSGAFLAVINNGYFITNTSTPTLPAAPSEGDAVAFIVDTGNVCTITANAGQKIRLGTTLSGLAGTCASNFIGDSITLVYKTAGTTWFAKDSIGTWSIT